MAWFASAHPAHRNVSITACAAETYVHEVRVGLKPHCLIAELGARTSGWRLQSEGVDVPFRRVDFFVVLHQCSSRLGTSRCRSRLIGMAEFMGT